MPVSLNVSLPPQVTESPSCIQESSRSTASELVAQKWPLMPWRSSFLITVDAVVRYAASAVSVLLAIGASLRLAPC